MKKFLLLLCLVFPCLAWAQDAMPDTTSAEKKVNYMPRLYGGVKVKFETSLYDGKHRFNVRNSRIGVKGNASRNMSYAVQIDFNNEGSVSILDSYITFAIRNLDISLGQQQYHFSTDLDRGPTSNIFANRSFLSKFLTTYYGEELNDGTPRHFVKSIGSRDIGAHFSYRTGDIPLDISFGVFNGSGSNNPEWSDNVNLIGRLDYGDKGFGAAVSHYNGNTPVSGRAVDDGTGGFTTEKWTQKIRMWGGELRYVADKFHIEE